MKPLWVAPVLAVALAMTAWGVHGATQKDTIPPKITVFSVPVLINNLKVPVTAFAASDNVAIAGYMITLSNVPPSVSAASWSGTAPKTYTSNTPGLKTLYAWAKDKAGNLSIPAMAKVNIDTTRPIVGTFAIPPTTNTLTIPVTAFIATDNTAVTGYLITENATPPSLQAASWTASAPTSYKVANEGPKTLYAWAKDGAGNVSAAQQAATQVVLGNAFNLNQTLSDGAQRTTLAFAGLGLMTGNLAAQSFFPPGKVADYTGFQYLRDNDPDNMGHNTSFLTRVANNVIYMLSDSQFAQLKTLATAQIDEINTYGYQRYPLMKAFRRLLEGDIPAGSTGLNLHAIQQASRALYLIDGQISFDRALLYASILNTLDANQRAYLEAMKGKGWNSWPDISAAQIESRMKGLPQGTAVAVMTYAGDLYSWYAGSVDADVYFCPERHGTYYGSFYMKDAPAVGHEGYSINEQLTATAGAALSDSSKGYVTVSQAALMSSLVDTQRNNLYAGAGSTIVKVRTEIATLLRSLRDQATSAEVVKARVLELSGLYGDLDGENNYAYATVFTQVYNSLTADQRLKLQSLRASILSGTYADGTPYDYTVAQIPYLYSQEIKDISVLTPYVGNTDYLFFEPQ